MPSIDINAPQGGGTVTSPFDVQGPYSLVDSKETEANVKVVVSHPNGQDYPFGPQAPGGATAYDVTCNNIPSSNGDPATVTASLLKKSDNSELASQTTQVVIS